jgi:uncharacterized membrane protein
MAMELNNAWILLSAARHVLAGACWIPVVWLQLQLAQMSAHACARGEPHLCTRYWAYAKAWEKLGYPAFVAMVLVYFLMVLKPV